MTDMDKSRPFLPHKKYDNVKVVSNNVFSLKEEVEVLAVVLAIFIGIICLLPIPFCCLGIFLLCFIINGNLYRYVEFDLNDKKLKFYMYNILFPCWWTYHNKEYNFSEIEGIYLLKRDISKEGEGRKKEVEGIIAAYIKDQSGEYLRTDRDDTRTKVPVKKVILFRGQALHLTRIHAQSLRGRIGQDINFGKGSGNIDQPFIGSSDESDTFV